MFTQNQLLITLDVNALTTVYSCTVKIVTAARTTVEVVEAALTAYLIDVVAMTSPSNPLLVHLHVAQYSVAKSSFTP